MISLEEQEKLREEGRQEAEGRQTERINQLTEQVSFILLIISNTLFQKESYNITTKLHIGMFPLSVFLQGRNSCQNNYCTGCGKKDSSVQYIFLFIENIQSEF